MASEQRTTPEMRGAVRAEYMPRSVPACVLCHASMPFDRTEAHNFVYRCREHGFERPVARGDMRVLAVCDDADALDTALAEAERLRDALAFYADPERWRLSKDTPGSPWVTAGACWRDKGQRARDALAGAQGATDGRG